MMPLFLASAISDSLPASIHTFPPQGILVLIDAAVRTMLVACVLAAALRIVAPRHVPAQKAAWGLVLAGAFLMPLVAPLAENAAWLPSGATLTVPARAWWDSFSTRSESLLPQTAVAHSPEAVAAASAVAAMQITAASAAPVARTQPHQPASLQADRFPAPTISYGQTGAKNSPAPSVRSTFYLPLSDVAWMIYGAICMTLLLRLSYGLGGAVGLWQSAEAVDLDSHLADGLRIRCSRKICSPVTVGSAVVLPSDYDQWDPEKLRIVLAHERAHVRQGDFYLQALAGVYAAIFWFSPLGWWLKRKLSDLGETISDRAGLEEAASHASYAQILLEFAAMPRQMQVGVAMAHTGRIAQRIERLLNETSFRQAFAGGQSRLWAALVIVPAVLFAAAALIRVQAAQTVQQPFTAGGPVIALSQPAHVSWVAPAHQELPNVQTASVHESANPQPVAPQAIPAPSTAPAPMVAPVPPSDGNEDQVETATSTDARCNSASTVEHSSHTVSHVSTGRGYAYVYSDDGDSYALVSGNGKDHVTFSGDWHQGRRAELDKARSAAHGDFLWFTRNGKSYVIDDPQTIAQIQAMYRPMEDLGRQQEELGRRQAELGRQQSELGKRQQQASIPTPDVSREMANLNAALAKLEAKRSGTVTMEQLADLQSKIGELQGKLGGLQGEIGSRQGELGRQQGQLGEQQGRLGEQQGRLGAEQGRLAHEADTKVKSIIDDSLKNGHARQVQ